MLITWLITGATLLIAVVVIAIVAVGNGAIAERAPDDLAHALAATEKHLNGEAEPPKPLVDLFGAIPELRPSARSADSATVVGADQGSASLTPPADSGRQDASP